MWSIFVTRRIPEAGLNLLRQECHVEMNRQDHPLDHEEFLESAKERDGLLTLLTDKVDAVLMDRAGSRLKVISNYAVGYNNIDVVEANRRGIVVTNTPEVLTESSADFTWALLLGIARRIVEGDGFTRAGKFKGWNPLLLLGGDVHGKTLGIVGVGRIGTAVAKRASGFNMKVLGYHPQSKGKAGGLPVTFVSLEDLLRESDFVSIHVPLIEQTYHLIGEDQLRMMKPTAYLINTSRGPVVDEIAMAKALKEKWIAGAALDVYEQEPRIHPGLLNMPNVILAPHIASASIETRTEMSIIAAKNLLAVLKGEPPLYRVNSN